jgi:hypothetical protein
MMAINQKRISFIKNHIWRISLFIVFLCSPYVFAEVDSSKTKDEDKNNVYNLYDADLGKIEDDGTIYNKYGTLLGSVDDKGIIHNSHNVMIGEVKDDGTVVNQSGTKIGLVNMKGEVFNVSDRKVGSVKGVDDIKLIGGAARLLILKTYSRRRNN